jgi:hypothetical protein
MRFHELLLEQNNFFHFIGDLMELWNKLKDQNQSTVCHWRGQTRDSPIASAPISRRHRGQSHRIGDRDVRRLGHRGLLRRHAKADIKVIAKLLQYQYGSPH